MFILNNYGLLNPGPVESKEVLTKGWKEIGDGKEVLSSITALQITESEEDKKLASSLAKRSTIEKGDYMLYDNKWMAVEEVKKEEGKEERILKLKESGKTIEVPAEKAMKYIPVSVLLCSANNIGVHNILVRGSRKISSLEKSLLKAIQSKGLKADW